MSPYPFEAPRHERILVSSLSPSTSTQSSAPPDRSVAVFGVETAVFSHVENGHD